MDDCIYDVYVMIERNDFPGVSFVKIIFVCLIHVVDKLTILECGILHFFIDLNNYTFPFTFHHLDEGGV